jgi:multiple antibiotic resistance protein
MLGMSLVEYGFLAVTSLFVIMDPIALIPTFLAMTPMDLPQERIRMARLACFVSAGVLIFFVITGQHLFKLLGITFPAFKIAGGILLLTIALDMLRARRSSVKQTTEETDAAAAKDDIAITPLAVPMLAGPGAISTAILLQSKGPTLPHLGILILAIVIVCVASYLILRWASRGARWISPIAMKITTRIMGLLLAAVAVQFMLDAIFEEKARFLGQ